jgi:transposase
VEPTITFTSATVKELTTRLRLAMRLGQVWLIQRITALLLIHDGLDIYTIAGRLGVSTTAIYAWRDAFLVKRWQSLTRGKSSGRPQKLTPCQRARLKELVLAGPEQAGYDTGCWNAALI